MTLTLKELLDSYSNEPKFKEVKKKLTKHIKTLSIKEVNDLASECDQISLDYYKSNDKELAIFFNRDVRKVIETEARIKFRSML